MTELLKEKNDLLEFVRHTGINANRAAKNRTDLQREVWHLQLPTRAIGAASVHRLASMRQTDNPLSNQSIITILLYKRLTK